MFDETLTDANRAKHLWCALPTAKSKSSEKALRLLGGFVLLVFRGTPERDLIHSLFLP